MKKILSISHGDKGGVGKSMVTMFSVEKLLKFGHVALIEADPTQPDIGKRYANDPDIVVCGLSLNRAGDAENALSRFGQWLEKSGEERVIVNLPAGAGETLDVHADMIRALADSLGYRLVVTYSLEKNETAARTMLKSLESGLMSVVDSENRYVVFPLYKGEPDSFFWFHAKERQDVRIGEIVMPALKNTKALSLLESTLGRVSTLVDKENRPEGWFVIDQISIFRFYEAGLQAISPIFEGGQ